MTKRTTALLRVIEVLDAKIEGLKYAKELLLEQQRAAPLKYAKELLLEQQRAAGKAPASVTAKVG